MYYLIQTPYHSRPYLTNAAFLARDFRSWGCRVDTFQNNSPYIAEVRCREKKLNSKTWRIELMEHWTREVISRRQHARRQDLDRGYRTQTVIPMIDNLSTDDARLERTNSLLRDFVDGVAACSKANTVHHAGPTDPRPLPSGPVGLVSKYMRFLHAVRYTSNAPLPSWSTMDWLAADQITLEFRSHAALQRGHLAYALNKAIHKDLGQQGRIERDLEAGVVRVVLLAEVTDLVFPLYGGSEKVDPLPLYERYEKGEGPPEYAEM